MNGNGGKRTKVMVATILYDIDPVVYASQLNVFYEFGKAKQDGIDLIFYGPWRTPIDRARNDIAYLALYHECDYIFFYDDDMYFHDANTPLRLLKRCIDNPKKIHIIQALAYVRGYPFKPMLFKWAEVEKGKALKSFDNFKDYVDSDGLVKCGAVGCPATVIDTSLFKQLPPPWFHTGERNTEDIFFCVKAQQYFEDVGIYCDTNEIVGHLMDRPILTQENAEWLKELYDNKRINQIFLEDFSFKKTIEVSRNDVVFEERINPIDLFSKEKKDG